MMMGPTVLPDNCGSFLKLFAEKSWESGGCKGATPLSGGGVKIVPRCSEFPTCLPGTSRPLLKRQIHILETECACLEMDLGRHNEESRDEVLSEKPDGHQTHTETGSALNCRVLASVNPDLDAVNICRVNQWMKFVFSLCFSNSLLDKGDRYKCCYWSCQEHTLKLFTLLEANGNCCVKTIFLRPRHI